MGAEVAVRILETASVFLGCTVVNIEGKIAQLKDSDEALEARRPITLIDDVVL